MKTLFRRATATAVAALLMTAPALAPASASSSVPITHAVTIAAAVATPKIAASPASVTVASGKTHSFSVKASGSKLKYQWYVQKPKTTKWVKASGDSAKTKSLKVAVGTGHHGSKYRVVVSNTRAKMTSKSAKLTVVTKPKITGHPKSLTAVTKSQVKLSTTVSGGSLSYQWQKKKGSTWSNISKATKSTHTFTASSKASSTEYRVLASNKAGKATSGTAKVTVVSKPTVVILDSIVAVAGKPTTLKSNATGGSLSYQWQRWNDDGTPNGKWSKITGATRSSFTFTAASKNDMDTFRLAVSNKAGTATSDYMTLYVDSTPGDPMRIDQYFILSDWQLQFSDPWKETSDTESGMTDLYANMTVINEGSEARLPEEWLTIEYIGNDGKVYDGYDYDVDDSYLNIKELSPAGQTITKDAMGYGLVFADVPSGAVSGGVWRVTEERFGDVQYVKGF